MDQERLIDDQIQDHQRLFSRMGTIMPEVIRAGALMAKRLSEGRKILICGNGGSASDAQHLAAEMVGRFERERRAIPAISLSTDTSILTCLGNDYGYEKVFSRQVEALGNREDILVAISTSGNSQNILEAVETADGKDIFTIGLLGNDGGKLAALVDISVIVPHEVTARIQEAHIFIIHFWAGMIDRIC
jgi:D-sedoheptulose 7-phosphate isomerase